MANQPADSRLPRIDVAPHISRALQQLSCTADREELNDYAVTTFCFDALANKNET
jgi:hypothetical protein